MSDDDLKIMLNNHLNNMENTLHKMRDLVKRHDNYDINIECRDFLFNIEECLVKAYQCVENDDE